MTKVKGYPIHEDKLNPIGMVLMLEFIHWEDLQRSHWHHQDHAQEWNSNINFVCVSVHMCSWPACIHCQGILCTCMDRIKGRSREGQERTRQNMWIAGFYGVSKTFVYWMPQSQCASVVTLIPSSLVCEVLWCSIWHTRISLVCPEFEIRPKQH
jgi:hypothetical protein